MKYLLIVIALMLSGCVHEPSFSKGDCLVRSSAERWEKPTYFKVLDVGNKYYHVDKYILSQFANPNKYFIFRDKELISWTDDDYVKVSCSNLPPTEPVVPELPY